MNTFLRPTLRTTNILRRTSIPFRLGCQSPTPLARPAGLCLPKFALLAAAKPVPAGMQWQARRTVASQVSNRPGSQSLEHAATNIKEEMGNSASDLAKTIAAANNPTDSIIDHDGISFFGITAKVAHEVPQPILVLGLAGGIPYLGASAITIWLARQAELATSGVMTKIDPGVASTMLDQSLNFQVTYGAVLLSFLGALHWGFEMAAYGGYKGYARLALGTAPMLVAWTSLGMQPMTALVVQWMAFTGLWYADSRVTMAGWTPKWYSQYRFYLSILIGICIIGSLAGTSYWGPVAGHGFMTHELENLRERRGANMPQKYGMIQGPVEAVPAPDDADRFTLIRRRDKD